MFIVSGIKRDKGYRDMINLNQIASIGVTTVPKYAAYEMYNGDTSLMVYYPNLEDNEVIFIGSLDECIKEQEYIAAAINEANNIYYVTLSELLQEKEGE